MPESVPVLVALLIALPGIAGVVYVVRFKSGGLESAQVANTLLTEQLAQVYERMRLLERRITILEWVDYTNAQKLTSLGIVPATVRDAEIALGMVDPPPKTTPSANGLDAANSLRRFIAGNDDNPPAFNVAELNQLVSGIGWNPDSLSGESIEDRAASAVGRASRLGELEKLRDAAYKARPGRRIE